MSKNKKPKGRKPQPKQASANPEVVAASASASASDKEQFHIASSVPLKLNDGAILPEKLITVEKPYPDSIFASWSGTAKVLTFSEESFLKIKGKHRLHILEFHRCMNSVVDEMDGVCIAKPPVCMVNSMFQLANSISHLMKSWLYHKIVIESLSGMEMSSLAKFDDLAEQFLSRYHQLLDWFTDEPSSWNAEAIAWLNTAATELVNLTQVPALNVATPKFIDERELSFNARLFVFVFSGKKDVAAAGIVNLLRNANMPIPVSGKTFGAFKIYVERLRYVYSAIVQANHSGIKINMLDYLRGSFRVGDLLAMVDRVDNPQIQKAKNATKDFIIHDAIISAFVLREVTVSLESVLGDPDLMEKSADIIEREGFDMSDVLLVMGLKSLEERSYTPSWSVDEGLVSWMASEFEKIKILTVIAPHEPFDMEYLATPGVLRPAPKLVLPVSRQMLENLGTGFWHEEGCYALGEEELTSEKRKEAIAEALTSCDASAASASQSEQSKKSRRRRKKSNETTDSSNSSSPKEDASTAEACPTDVVGTSPFFLEDGADESITQMDESATIIAEPEVHQEHKPMLTVHPELATLTQAVVCLRTDHSVCGEMTLQHLM